MLWIFVGEVMYKYNEDTILEELKQHVDSTYTQHYSSEKLQTIDVWEALGIEQESCQSNVIKYAMRYGKKNGNNKDDLLKILHYTILWWHSNAIGWQHAERPEAAADWSGLFVFHVERAESGGDTPRHGWLFPEFWPRR